jgi:DHA2 family multidrug resistance protein-like MFS transporter
MDGAVSHLPGPAANAAQNQLGGALAVAQRVGGQAGEALVHTARSAFVSGMHTAAIVAAAVAIAGALLSVFFLPARSLHAEPVTA